uniref:Uncharacterized protein n=1 Tax=uncultured marine group II/III euryarchaeote AD1000_104_B06 TaxID=1457712 RepID=A0A075FHW7_9EURY|nr:hypothetical protein [uncultured marine group II/III euryarchaeote AD1000_104_B06]
MSEDSSGWKVKASLFPVLTPTTSSPCMAATVADLLCDSNRGARMNTPGKSRPRMVASRVLWKESACRPYALRSMSASTRGTPPSRGSASSIAPAQVPSTGRDEFERIHSKRAGRSLDVSWFPVSRIVVDSPPGSTIA